jgi:hypothetical protein
MYVSNWFGDTVQQFDIADPFHPTLKAAVKVPHPNMLESAATAAGCTSRTRCSPPGTTTRASVRATPTTASGYSRSARTAASHRRRRRAPVGQPKTSERRRAA